MHYLYIGQLSHFFVVDKNITCKRLNHQQTLLASTYNLS